MSIPLLTVRAPGDTVLHHICPLGLAAAAGTALVVDLDGATTYPGPTLADLDLSGLRRDHLEPARTGVAVLGRGEIDLRAALSMVDRLRRRWPHVVVRVSDTIAGLPPPITVRASIPTVVDDSPDDIVRQRVSWMERVDGPSLPPVGRSRVLQMLASVVDPRWRWVRAWRPAWSGAWS